MRTNHHSRIYWLSREKSRNKFNFILLVSRAVRDSVNWLTGCWLVHIQQLSYYYMMSSCGHWNGIIRVFRNFSSFIATTTMKNRTGTRRGGGIYAQFSFTVSPHPHTPGALQSRRTRSGYTMLHIIVAPIFIFFLGRRLERDAKVNS